MLRIRTFGKVSIEIPFSEASVGDILCSDNKVVAPADYSASGKTAIGIVINKSSGVLRIMALNTVTNIWGGYGTDLSLDNITTQQNAVADINGESNTQTMISEIGNIPDDTIAMNAYTYSVTGAISGCWYLGAAGEINMILQNLSTINSTRQTLGLSAVGSVIVSSTEYDADGQWYAYTGDTTQLYYGIGKYLNYPSYPLLKKTY